jgi:hypothetical protein
MVALAPAQIPSTCDTVEKLHVWSGAVLLAVAPTLVVIEGQGFNERAVQLNPFFISADNKHRLITRSSIQLDPAYLSGGLKFWQYAMVLSTATIPTGY